jgi:hypothetical protein
MHTATHLPPKETPEAHAEVLCPRKSHRLRAFYGTRPKQSACLPTAGPLEVHAEVLCRRRRRHNYGSNKRRRWRARREATGQAHRREGNRLKQLTQHATHESKTEYIFFMQKNTQPSQKCSGGRITPNPTKIDGSDAFLLMGSIN